MRVTNEILIREYMMALSDKRLDAARLREHVASNRQILKPSDDPTGTVQAMGFRNTLSSLDQLQTVHQTTQRHLSILDVTLNEVTSLLNEANVLAVQGSNDTLSSEERAHIAVRVDGLIRDMVGMANTRIDRTYIFGGTDTTTPPYTLTVSGDNVSDVTAHASPSDERLRNLGAGVTMAINIPGEEVFNRNINTFDVLIDLRDALLANDSESIRNAIGAVEIALDQTSQAMVEVGNRLRRLDLLSQQTEQEVLETRENLSTIEEIDVAEMLVRLNASETTMQVALSIGARLLPQSLIDFLR